MVASDFNVSHKLQSCCADLMLSKVRLRSVRRRVLSICGTVMICHVRFGICLLFVALFNSSPHKSALGDQWWQFRGPNSGHVNEQSVPTNWGGADAAPVWASAIPGRGWSSPIVIGDRIWLTSAEELAIDSRKAKEKLEALPFGSVDIVVDAAVTLFALEIDGETGEILRRIDLFECKEPQPIHAMNSYATPTPVTDGEVIIFHFGAQGTACFDLTSGKIVWKRTLFVDELTGAGSSPILWANSLILACDGADQQYLTALDKRTGETQWKVDRPPITVVDDSHRRAFSTPIVIQSNDRTQLISLAAQWLISYNPQDGSEWWRAKVGTGYSLVPTPVFDRDRVFVCTGFTSPEMVAVSTTGSGDITDSGILWRFSRQVPEVSSPIVVGNEIYFGSSRGIITCLDAASGEMLWQHRAGGNFAASPICVGDRIYMTNSGGITTVFKAGREYQELATNEALGETYASISVYKESLLLRTHPMLLRLGKKAE